jgi:hypothetical protein
MAASVGNFAALAGPTGVWLLEYADEGGGLRVVQSWSDAGPYASADEAFAALRRLLDARGARRAALAVTVNGFGALHHTVLLPNANAEVLEPLVRREVMRSFDLVDPRIQFEIGDSVERRASPRGEGESGLRNVFIAAIPRDTAAAIQQHLTGGNIHVQAVTVVAESLRHIFASLRASRDPTAVLVCLASGPYLAFFLHGQPEIIIDPPGATDAESAMDPELLCSQVERGTIYFRQRFGGAEPARLLLAAAPADDGSLAAMLHEATGIPVEPLMQGGSSPEAIIAMGAVFASRAPGAIDLFERAPTPAQRLRALTRSYGAPTIGIGALALIVALWLALQVISLERAASARDTLQKTVNAAIASAAPAKSMAQERAAHQEQASALSAIYGERSRLAGTLASVARIAGAGVRFDSLIVDQTKKGWSVSINGAVLGAPGSYAVRTLNEFYGALRTEPAVSLPNLERFDYARPGADTTQRGTAVALTFVVSFDIPAAAENDR